MTVTWLKRVKWRALIAGMLVAAALIAGVASYCSSFTYAHSFGTWRVEVQVRHDYVYFGIFETGALDRPFTAQELRLAKDHGHVVMQHVLGPEIRGLPSARETILHYGPITKSSVLKDYGLTGDLTNDYGVSLRVREVAIPGWLIMAPAVLYLAHVARTRVAAKRALGVTCKCGYDLRGSSDRCSECGETVTR